MKKRDTEMAAAYLGVSVSKGSEHRHSGNAGATGGSPFSISRFLSSRSRRRQHSKSRMSLDSESTRSESSLAAHNVASTSLPAFHSSIAAPPLSRSNNATAINSVVKNMSAGGPQSASSVSSIVSKKQGNGMEGPHRECPVCLTEQSADCFPPIQTCHHRSCVQCLRQYLQIEISESRVNIACPECNERFHPNDMRAILEDEVLMGKYEDFMLRRVLAMDPDTRWCPAPDCGYAVIAAGCAGCPKLKCEREGCDTFFCYHCKQRWHPNQTCDAARAERSPNIRSASISYSHESNSQNEIKPCPRCGAFIVKMNDGSCNHMTCAVCAAEFCWLCMKEISDLHYLSPSGCTFWGRKPWSRKKKILWQLGTLVGAPVGITLVAGIAVPAMIIGIPVWVGRKIHARYRLASRHKRNLAITGGVAASILASPIIAGLAVGIGVPILLAYVYGVVPISLCRSGGCGVTTTNTGGVRFEFDEENEAAGQGNYAGDNHSETMPPVANPSIAPSIGDASLGMTNSLSASGSHMDRVGVLRDADSDRDSASNRAIAGASLNGSLCGSTYTNKLEVQVDVVASGGPQKRASFSSESANFSLSERSATVSFDEVSMRVAYSDGQGRDNGETIASAEGSEARDADVHTIDSADWVNSTPSGASATSPQSPHAPCRSGLGEEIKHGTKCKKLTRFVDDVAEITASAACCKLEEVEFSRVESRSRDRRSSEQSPLREEPTLGPSMGFKEGPPVKRSCSQGRKEGIADRPKTICLTKEQRQIPQSASLLRKSAVADVNDAEEIKHGGLESGPSETGTGLCGTPLENSTSHVTIGRDSGDAALPEVDTDKPVGPYQSSASTEDASEPQFLGSRGRSLSCFSLHKTSLEETAAAGETLSSSTGLTGDKECCRPQQGSIRRHSYEQALQHDQTMPILLKLSQ